MAGTWRNCPRAQECFVESVGAQFKRPGCPWLAFPPNEVCDCHADYMLASRYWDIKIYGFPPQGFLSGQSLRKHSLLVCEAAPTFELGTSYHPSVWPLCAADMPWCACHAEHPFSFLMLALLHDHRPLAHALSPVCLSSHAPMYWRLFLRGDLAVSFHPTSACECS